MDINLMNGNFCSAEQYRRALEEVEKEKKQQKIEEERKIEKLNSPIVEQLRSLVEQSNKQVNVLQEENEIRKQQVAKLEESEERARKEARSAKILSIISFCVSTAIAIASLIEAIVK